MRRGSLWQNQILLHLRVSLYCDPLLPHIGPAELTSLLFPFYQVSSLSPFLYQEAQQGVLGVLGSYAQCDLALCNGSRWVEAKDMITTLLPLHHFDVQTQQHLEEAM